MSLACLTRGGSSPQGKQRVWFCCHPDDLALYLESVAGRVLALQNCAVWYDPAPDVPWDRDQRRQDLSQMQLLVMPVTTRLLTLPCAAMELDFPLAAACRIPVLPLMMEPGLEELFGQKCGDLQFLDPNAHDPTALPFEEKLKRFLDSVLVGDQLAAQVRAAFDAYIFLSYRKKDRRQARELMGLIHQNRFCRDVAIWYDEFLTPGEDFNQAIADALEKSRLFALVVTPNLLEESNYVMTTEYPMARAAAKPILPVEMVPTDRGELGRRYSGIPACAGKDDRPALSEGLLACLRDLAREERRDDPRHSYFMGLAYLGGIDVEVDHPRALELIRSGAEAGYEPAMVKLAGMYRSGEGVDRDLSQAARWQSALAERRRARWRLQPDESAFLALTGALWDLANDYRQIQDLPRWRQVWQEDLLPLCARVWEERRLPAARRLCSIAHGNLGDICLAEGDQKAAGTHYARALEIDRQLAGETPTPQARRDLSFSYSRLGNLHLWDGALEAARASYLSALEIDRQLAREDPTLQARRDLAATYNSLCALCREAGEPEHARDYCLLDLELTRQLAREDPTPQSREALVISLHQLGDLYLAEEDPDQAGHCYTQAMELCRQLVEEAPTLEARRDLSLSWNKLGDLRQAEGELEQARDCYLRALELCRRLAEEAPTQEHRRNLSACCDKLCTLCQEQGETEQAMDYFRTVLELTRQLVREAPTPLNRRNLSACWARLGALCQQAGDLEGARAHYVRALELCRQLAAESDAPEYRDHLAMYHYNLGIVEEDHAPHWRAALELWAGLARRHPQVPDYAQRRDYLAQLLEETEL